MGDGRDDTEESVGGDADESPGTDGSPGGDEGTVSGGRDGTDPSDPGESAKRETESPARTNTSLSPEQTNGTPAGDRRASREQRHADRRGRTDPSVYVTDRRSLSPRIQVLWAVRVGIMSLILGLISAFALLGFDRNPQFGAVAVAAVMVLGTVWLVLYYRRWVYQIQDDAIYLERGVFTHVRTLVPYVRIQHVDTSRGPVERLLGLSTLVVYTAGSRGADVSIPGLTPDRARDLQQRVKELAIEAEGDDAV